MTDIPSRIAKLRFTNCDGSDRSYHELRDLFDEHFAESEFKHPCPGLSDEAWRKYVDGSAKNGAVVEFEYFPVLKRFRS